MWTRPVRRVKTPDFDRLEGRIVMSGLNISAVSTTDSQSVTVDYQVTGSSLTEPVAVGIYRSASAQYQAGDPLIAVETVPATEAEGSPGAHTLNMPISGGLPPDPADPYVLAVANPASGTSSASFRTYVIGVVVHGGIQDGNQIPGWEAKLAKELKAVGYDKVIAFNWAAQSNTPGAAAKQGPRLANAVRKASLAFPEGSPVDLHLIGHSEGAVVVSQALKSLEYKTTPALQAGYLKVTLLDPHAANNKAPGGLLSTGPGIAGEFARFVIRTYQAKANDPLVVIPPTVDDAEVFYQHTPVGLDKANDGVYNLWGEVPIKGVTQYADLSGPAVAHSGGGGVQVWYSFHVVPTLRDGGNVFVDPTRLTATFTPTGGLADAVNGSAAPGASITVFARNVQGVHDLLIGKTTADASGTWSVDGRTLPAGKYRIYARVEVSEGLPSPRAHLYHAVAVGNVTFGTGGNRVRLGS